MRLAFIPASCLPYALDNYHQNDNETEDDDDDDDDDGYMIDARAFQEVYNYRIGSDDRKKTQSTVGGGGVVTTRDDHNRSDGTGPGAVVMMRGVTSELAWDGDIGVMKR